MEVKIGDTVKVKNDRPEDWFKKGQYPEFLVGQVIKVFDKGTFSMRISDQKKRVQHFRIEEIIQ